jgi:predicted site-specific integrase-resolvase
MTFEEAKKEIERIYPRKLYLSNKEVAQLRGIDYQTIDRERKAGIGITPTDDGKGKYKFSTYDMADWMVSHRIKTA